MKRFFISAFVGILAIFIAIPLSAQNIVPNPPQQLTANFKENADGNFDVELNWVISSQGIFPEGFKIYKTVFQNGVVSTFLEAELQSQQGHHKYSYVVRNLPTGTYEFYATSYLGKAESKPSNTVHLVLTKHEPFIKIISQPPIYAYVGKKYVYKIQVQTNINCPVDIFEFEGNPPQGMTISQNGVLEWIPQQTGEYSVTIKVGTSCKINVQPTFQTFKIIVLSDQPNDKPYVRIVSQPPTSGIVGVPINYQVVAESNIRCPIKFKLIDGNINDAEIDEETGLFKWTPTKAGQFAIAIVAYLSCDTNVVAYQRLCFVIKETPNEEKHCAHVVGTAKFEDDTPVQSGIVTAWKLDPNNNQTNLFFKTYIKNGAFEFFLPSGVYVFEFNGEQFEHLFYAQATRFLDATKIKLECNNQNNEYPLEVTLQKKPQPILFNVSGYVLSSTDLTPVPAIVEFIPVEFLFNSDRKQNYGAISNFITKTDQNGHYQITLPNNFTYIAHAKPISNQQKYRDQYFYLSNSPYLADIIELNGDREDINFLLEQIETIENGFSGIVIDKDRNPIQSRVMAIMVRPHQGFDQNKPPFSRIVETNENGQFTFTNLVPGDYVLLSIPIDKQFAPGYYKVNDFATLKWKEATIISVDKAMIQIIYEIKHRNRSGWKGLVRIDGQVIDGTQNVKITDQPECWGAAITEALVCAVDNNGDVIDFYITDQSGNFSLESLPPTTLKLLVSKVGYKDFESTISTDYESNAYVNKSIYLEQEVSTVIENDKFNIWQNGQNLFVRFDGSFMPNEIRVYDLFGNALEVQFTLEENIARIDLNQLTSGVYILRLSNSKDIITTKFLVLH